MLSITDGRLNRDCEGYSRRELLTVGGLGFLGLSLADWLGVRKCVAEATDAAAGGAVKDRSVVFLFLQGGPPHIETFDPKMTAPSDYRAIFGEVKTCLPGVTFGSHFPQLARRADRLAVVRSFGSGNNGHTYGKVASGDNHMKAAMGAVYARLAGTNRSRTGMPSNVLVTPEGVEPGLVLDRNFETQALPTLTDPGELRQEFQAFNPAGGGTLQENMELRIPPSRFAARRELLDQLDQLRRVADEPRAVDLVHRYQQQAFEVITRGVGEAFDLSKEDPRTVARYDTSHIFSGKKAQRWGDMRRATNLLGKQMLLARRLCESGCGFVTVSDCGWDMHSNSNSPRGMKSMDWLGSQVDHAVAAFMDDVEARGLSDKILLVVTGEMGRTPRVNKGGGRDHYGELTPLLLFGGGLRMGQIIGESSSKAEVPATRAYGPKDLRATILHTLLDVDRVRVNRDLPAKLIEVITGGEPIPELV